MRESSGTNDYAHPEGALLALMPVGVFDERVDVSESGTGSMASPAHSQPTVSFATPNSWRSKSKATLRRHQRLVVFVDLIAVSLAAVFAALLRFRDTAIGFHIAAYIPVVVAAWMLVLTARDSYSFQSLQSRRQQAGSVLGAAFFVFPAVAGVSYLLKDSLSRAFLLYSIIFSTAVVLLGRVITMRSGTIERLIDPLQQRTLLLGSWDIPEPRTSAAGFGSIIEMPLPQQGHFTEWLTEVISRTSNEAVDVVLLAPNHDLKPSQLQRLSWALEGSVDLVKIVAIGTLGRRAFLRTTETGTYLHLLDVGLTGPKALVKRLFDILLSVLGLVVLSPLLLLTAIAVKLTSRGPIFYVQQRVGQHGALFPFPKFRSMKVGADKERADVLGTPDDEMLERYRNDPRITKVGRVIRRLSIDEAPQIWSVLKGDMSIVGPRPVLPEEMDLVGHVDQRRHIAKPGLTGLWQVSGRKEVPWDERMRMDIDYIEGWSLAGDVALVVRTLAVVVTGRGAM